MAGSRNTEFLKLVERTEAGSLAISKRLKLSMCCWNAEGAFQSGDDTAVED